MQGKIAARDLIEHRYHIVLADLQRESASKLFERFPDITFEFVDLKNIEATEEVIRKFKPKVVVNCAEGDWNLNVYKACLESGVHVIDLGSDIAMTKEQLAMGPYFGEDGLTAITGCGSTPGINNIALHYAHSQLDLLDSVEAGFAWDSNIKVFVVPFSIQSVIEEFTDPATVIEDGQEKTVVPLETVEEREFRGIGKQKILKVRHPETYTFFLYNQNDGLKNVSYYAGFPDHSFNAILDFIKQDIPINELSEKLRKVVPPANYKEKENLWVNVSGTKNGEPKRILMETIVDTQDGWEDAGCNVDTGQPASIIAQMIYDGRIEKRGSFAPGPVVPTTEFLKELKDRQMIMYCNGVAIN